MKSLLLFCMLSLVSMPTWAFKCNKNQGIENCNKAKAKIVDNSQTKSKSDATGGTATSEAAGGAASVNVDNSTDDDVPDLFLGGYSSSFSSAFCMGTAQLGVSGSGFGFGGGKPVADDNCMRVIRSQEYRALAAAFPSHAEGFMHMAARQMCTVTEEDLQACYAEGLIK